MKNNLCISCNNDYSKIIDDETNINSFCDCIKISSTEYIKIKDSLEISTSFVELKEKEEKELEEEELKEEVLEEEELKEEECDIKNFLNRICIEKNIAISNAEDIINKIKKGIDNKELNSIFLNITGEQKKDIEVYDQDIIYQITSTYNQNNKNYSKISKINLKECEKRLKEFCGLSEDESLIIFKVDIHYEGLLTSNVEYEIYNPINLEKLDLNICNNLTFEISIPVNINEEELYKYNTSSDYYNDKCNPFTSENGSDIIIKDRLNEFIINNLSLCEIDCKLIRYDNINKYTLCDCEIKKEINIRDDYIFDKDKFIKSLLFSDIKSFLNLDVMKCYYILFKKSGLIRNIGNYILLFSFFIYIITIIIFLSKGYKSIINQINNIIIGNKKNKNRPEHEIEKNRKIIKKQNTVIVIKYYETESETNKKIEKAKNKKKLKNINIPPKKT